ncbi:MAG TPA: DNA alkylation repair protein [Candidatus Dormibacteraeota bacterium]|jgi:3-methyladenine DNA glycosylase AlkD|nr:DNA alkylation repair protein [Candidatus Dormibacteraeota bacterium]
MIPALIDASLTTAIKEHLALNADPERAPRMRAYMKSSMPYRGVAAPALHKICRDLFRQHPLNGFEAWQATVLNLWHGAEFREDRYAAIDLTGDRLYRSHQTPAALPLYEELIVSGAWWDYVDTVAVDRIGPILRSHPAEVQPMMLDWSRSEHLWKRRTSIICQVGARAHVDWDLLRSCIEPNLADRDFFVRKAIGWALRQFARSQPEVVAGYVGELGPRLSPLSRREATKHLSRDSPICGERIGVQVREIVLSRRGPQ